MKSFLIALMLLSGSVANASWYPGDSSHKTEDEHFSFQDMSQSGHMALGAAITMFSEEVLIKSGMKPIPAALVAIMFTGVLGAAKEVFLDDYCSPSGIKAFWVGAAIGGVTFTVLKF